MTDVTLSRVKLGGIQVGDQMQSADLGSTISKLNNEVWGRSGIFFNPATYTEAATVPFLKAVGSQATQTNSYGGVGYGDIATDGSSRWVIAFGSATNVLVSTDNGATWALVAHNAGGTVTSVCYDSTHSLFLAAGNSATVFYVASVAAASVGSAWTVRTGSAITGGTVDAAKIRSSGGTGVIVCGGGTTGNASYSTNGTSWTAKNLISGLGSSSGQTLLVPMGGSVWLAMGAGVGTFQRSTDDGLTWANATAPFSTAVGGAAKNGAILLICDNNSNFYSSTTGATGSWTSLGKTLGQGYIHFSAAGGGIRTDGTSFYCPVSSVLSTSLSVDGRVAVSTDGINWQIRSVIGRSWADNSPTGVKHIIGLHTNGDFVMAPLLANTGAVYGNFGTTTGVGVPLTVSSSVTTNSAPPDITYVLLSK